MRYLLILFASRLKLVKHVRLSRLLLGLVWPGLALAGQAPWQENVRSL